MLANWSHTDNEQCNKSHSGAPIWFPNPVTAAWYYCSSFFFSPHYFVFFFCFSVVFVSFFSFLFIFGIENCTDHANSSSVFHFLLCVCFAIAEMKNCINFYHCLLIFSYAFHSCLTPWSPNSFALLSANSLFFFLLKKCKEKKKHTQTYIHIYLFHPRIVFYVDLYDGLISLRNHIFCAISQ